MSRDLPFHNNSNGTPSPLLTPDHSIKPLFEDDMAKLSPDVSNFSDLSTPSRGKQRLKVDVSQMRKGSVMIVDYKNESPYNKKGGLPKKSQFSGAASSVSSPMLSAPSVQSRVKSIFSKATRETAGTTTQGGFSEHQMTRSRFGKIMSLMRWRRALAQRQHNDENAAAALRNIVTRELQEKINSQPKSRFDFGEKITAMCISNDSQIAIIATHNPIDWTPRMRLRLGDTFKTEKTVEAMGNGRHPEERYLISPMDPKSQNAPFIFTLNEDTVEKHASEETPRNLSFGKAASTFMGNSGTKQKQPPSLWLFYIDTEVKEKLPLDDNYSDPEKEVKYLAITGDKKYIVAGWSDHSVLLYSLERKAKAYTFKNVTEHNIAGLAITNNDRYFIVGGLKDGSISVYDIVKHSHVLTINEKHSDHLKCMAFSPDRSLIISGFFDGTIKVIDRESKQTIRTFTIHQSENINTTKTQNFIVSLEVTRNGKSIIVGCEDTSVLVLDIETGKISSIFRHVHEKKITSLAVTSDDRYLVTASFDGSVGLIDLERKEHFHSYENAHMGTVTSAFISCDNTSIMTASHDGVFQIIHLMKKELVGVMENVHKGGIDAMALSKDNRYIISGSYDGSITVSEIETQTRIHCFLRAHERPIKAVQMTSDGKFIISGSDDCSIKIFAMFKWENTYTFENIHTDWITALALSSNDKVLVSGSNDRSIKIIYLNSHEVANHYPNAHDSPISCLKITPNNKFIVSGGLDRCVKIFSISKKIKGLLHTFKDIHSGPIRCLSVTPDGRHVVSGSIGKEIKILSLDKKELLHIIEDAHDDSINSVEMSKDGKYIISASNDRSIRVFDFSKRKKVYTISNAHKENILAALVTPNNGYIVSGSNDNVLKIFVNPYNLHALTITESDRISPLSYVGILILNFFLQEPDPEVKHRMITKYKDLNIYPQNMNLFHITAVFFPQKDLISFCLESGIQFSGDIYGRTPLHYLLNSDKIDLNNINYILENFDDIFQNADDVYTLMAEIAQDVTKLLHLTPALVVNILNRSIAYPLSRQETGEVTCFGAIQGGGEIKCVPYKYPSFTSTIKDKLVDAEGNQLLTIRMVLLFMDYDICSRDLMNILHALESVEIVEVFQTKAVSVLINYAWNLSKTYLYVLMSFYSVYMILLSVYASQVQSQKSENLGVALLVFAAIFLFYEFMHLFSAGKKIFFLDIWNYIDITANIMLIITVAVTKGGGETTLSKQWLMTITLFLCYSKWVSFFRIIDQTRNLIRIIIEILQDMKSFIVFLAIAVLGFSLIFYQFDQENEAMGYTDRLLLCYNLIYAGFDIGDYNSSQVFYLVIVTILLSVIFLNMLVAIMGGTYNRLEDTAILADSKEKIILTLESIITKKIFLQVERFFKRFKRRRHLLVPKLAADDEDSKTGFLFFVEDSRNLTEEETLEREWEKRINLMKSIVQEEVERQHETVQKRINGLESHLKRQDHRVSELKKSFGERMVNVDNNLVKIWNIFQNAKIK